MENLNYYESERYDQNERISLYECIQKIMKEDHYREQQDFDIFQTAREVAKYLIQSTFSSDSYYQSYIQNRRNQVELSSFHIEDSQTLRCKVSLKLPSPIETFQIHHKKPQEMPPHRILVTLDEDLGKADRVYQKCIWEDCVDEEGVLRPDYVLKWFNKGIIATCEEVKLEGNRQRLNRELECNYFETKIETRKDGTIYVHVSIDKEENYPTNFTINFVPSLPLKELPKQIRLRAPFPDRSEYVERRDKFIKAILKGIKSDAAPLCLEARVWLPCGMVGLDQSIGVTWAVSCSALEEKAFQDIRNAPNQTNLENVIILMDRIKQNHIMGLHPVTRSLIQNAIFHIYRMNLEKVQRVDQWFLKVMKLIANQLKGYCAPCCFMNSKNILEDWDLAFVQWMGKELEKIIRRLKRKPISLLDYIGTNKGRASGVTLQTDSRQEKKNPNAVTTGSIKRRDNETTENPSSSGCDPDVKNDLKESKDIDDREDEDSVDKDDNKTMLVECNSGDKEAVDLKEAKTSRNKEANPDEKEECRRTEMKKTIFVRNLNDENSNQKRLTHIYC